MGHTDDGQHASNGSWNCHQNDLVSNQTLGIDIRAERREDTHCRRGCGEMAQEDAHVHNSR
jgi:hypothetical protein